MTDSLQTKPPVDMELEIPGLDRQQTTPEGRGPLFSLGGEGRAESDFAHTICAHHMVVRMKNKPKPVLGPLNRLLGGGKWAKGVLMWGGLWSQQGLPE